MLCLKTVGLADTNPTEAAITPFFGKVRGNQDSLESNSSGAILSHSDSVVKPTIGLRAIGAR